MITALKQVPNYLEPKPDHGLLVPSPNVGITNISRAVLAFVMGAVAILCGYQQTWAGNPAARSNLTNSSMLKANTQIDIINLAPYTSENQKKGFEAKNTSTSAFSSFFGGTESDRINDLAVFKDGSIYITGATESTGSIGFNGYRNTPYGGTDAFLAKFDSTGKRIWATYIGGESVDIAYSVVVDSSGSVYVGGATESDDLPTNVQSHQQNFGGKTDAFLAKFSSSGSLEYISYYGGNEEDAINGMACDSFGNLVVTGYTESSSSIASGGNLNSIQGGIDGFVSLFNPLGEQTWGSYAGGSGDDIHNTVAFYGNEIYVGGSTPSTDTDLTNAFQSTYGGGAWDGWVESYSRNGTLTMGSYFGGEGLEEVFGFSNSGDAIALAGYSSSRNLSKLNSTIPAGNDANAFVAKLEKTGSLEWVTAIHGPGDDQAFAISNLASGYAIAGPTRGNFAGGAVDAEQPDFGGQIDGYYAVIDATGDIELLSYLGADSVDVANCIYATPQSPTTAQIIIGGYSNEKDFFGNLGYQNTNRGLADGFFTKYNLDVTLSKSITLEAELLLCPGGTFNATVTLSDFDQAENVEILLIDGDGNEVEIGSGDIDQKGTLEVSLPATLNGKYRLVAQASGLNSNILELSPEYLADFNLELQNNSTLLCRGREYTVTAAVASSYEYIWQIEGGEIIGSNTTPTLKFITPAISAESDIKVTLITTLVGTNACVGIDSLNFTKIAYPEFQITRLENTQDTVCQGRKVEYTLNQAEGWAVEWSANNASGLTPTNQGVSVIWEKSGKLTAELTNVESGCSVQVDLDQIVEPEPEFSITGAQETCSSCTETYKFSTTADSVAFSFDKGTLLNQTDSTITIDWNQTGQAEILIEYFSLGGECLYLANYMVNITAEPTNNFSGPEQSCVGSIAEYNTTNSPDYNYTWSLAGGGTIVEDNGNIIAVEWDEAGQWELKLFRTRLSDQVVDSVIKTIAIFAQPEIPSIGLPQSICAEQEFNINIQDYDENYDYSIELPLGSFLEQEISQSNTLTLSTTGTYTFRVVATNGSCTAIYESELTVNPTPDQPTINETQFGLRADITADSYLWFKDGELYPATSQEIEPKQSGTFIAQAKIGECLSKLSEPVQFIFVTVELNPTKAAVYYSTSDKSLVVPFVSNHFAMSDKLTATIFDINGRVITQTVVPGSGRIPTQLSSGIYFYTIIRGGNISAGEPTSEPISGQFMVVD